MKNLQIFFNELNREYFKNELTIKKIRIIPSMMHTAILAWYDRERQEIALSSAVIREGDDFIKEVIHHEMTHRWMH